MRKRRVTMRTTMTNDDAADKANQKRGWRRKTRRSGIIGASALGEPSKSSIMAMQNTSERSSTKNGGI
jgi:hypothetical protein